MDNEGGKAFRLFLDCVIALLLLTRQLPLFSMVEELLWSFFIKSILEDFLNKKEEKNERFNC